VPGSLLLRHNGTCGNGGHGSPRGIPEDYIGIRVDIPEDVEIGTIDVAEGWPDLVPQETTAEQGTKWVKECRQAVLRVPSATMSLSGNNYILNPTHSDFNRITFAFEVIRFDLRLRKHP
jgi:RES domain-containing protein